MTRTAFNEVIATDLYRSVLTDGEYVPYSLIKTRSESFDDRLYCACANMLGDNLA